MRAIALRRDYLQPVFIAPPIDDHELLARLPVPLRRMLEECNGYVLYHGGLHVRGACRAPTWHSLREVWQGPRALHRLFPAVRPDDVPYAEDAFGNQFLLRDGVVHKLSAEDGSVESLHLGLRAFDEAVRADPVGFLLLQPLERFRADGGVLEPGQLLSVWPPFITRESEQGVSLRAVPAVERIGFLADFARQIASVPDGERIRPVIASGAVLHLVAVLAAVAAVAVALVTIAAPDQGRPRWWAMAWAVVTLVATAAGWRRFRWFERVDTALASVAAAWVLADAAW